MRKTDIDEQPLDPIESDIMKGFEILSILFPPVCEACEALLDRSSNVGVCKACASSISALKPPHCPACGRTAAYENQRCGQCGDTRFHFDRAWATAWYDGPMKALIFAFKFGGQKHLKKYFSGRLIDFTEQHIGRDLFEGVVPVPLEEERKLSRGFNQCELLSKPLAQHFGKMHWAGLLKREPSGSPQSRLAKNERETNVKGGFTVTNPALASRRSILLIDDILTTGQTASECAHALKDAGATSVCVLALARGV